MNPANTINLFVDAHVFDGEHQGSRTFIKNLYGSLMEKRSLKLYLAAYDIENLKNYFPDSGNVTFIKYRSRLVIYRLLFDIPILIKKHGIHYAHFQYIVPLFKNCRFIVTTHDLIFNEYPDKFPFLYRVVKNLLFKRGIKRADILTTVSEYSKRSIQKYFGINAQNIHIIPNGVSNLFFAEYDKEKAKDYIRSKFGIEKIILLVSRIEPRKNHVLLLKAFLDLKLYKQGYYLALIGDVSIKTKAFDIVMNNLPEKSKPFVFTGSNTDDTDLLEFYRAAEIFVYPSIAEGFGIPPLEAAAVKIPVLCSNSTAMSGFTFFGDDHFDPDNYSLFKEKLSAVLNEQPGKVELGNRAAIVQKNYNWKKSAETLYRLIKKDCS